MVRPRGRFRALRCRSCARCPAPASELPALENRLALRAARGGAKRARAPAARAARGPRRRLALARPWRFGLPVLDQRGRDVLGLALVAARGVHGIRPVRGLERRTAGHGLAVGLGWAIGGARVLAPVALVVGGGALLLRPVLPADPPAAHRSGVRVRRRHPGAGRRHPRAQLRHARGHPRRGAPPICRATAASSARGCTPAPHRLVQSVGVDILVVFLLVTGAILLTGASLASVIRATGSGVIDTTPDGAPLRRGPAAPSRARPRTQRDGRAVHPSPPPRS